MEPRPRTTEPSETRLVRDEECDPLAEAHDVATKYGGELPKETLGFIAASQRRANRAQALAFGAAAVFALVALGAVWQWKVAVAQKALAVQETTIAERNFESARTTVDQLVSDLANGLRNVEGVSVATVAEILETAKKAVDRLQASAPDDPRLLRTRSAMLKSFVATYLDAGILQEGRAEAMESLDIDRRLAAQNPGDAKAQRELSDSLKYTGAILLRADDQSAALAAYKESLDIDRKLAALDPGDAGARREVAMSLSEIGDVKRQVYLAGGSEDELAAARAAYQESLDVAVKLAALVPDDDDAQRDLATSLSKIASVKLMAADTAGCLAAYRQSLDIRRKLVAEHPDNAMAERDMLIGLKQLAFAQDRSGDRKGALALIHQALPIAEKLAALDSANEQAQADLASVRKQIADWAQ